MFVVYDVVGPQRPERKVMEKKVYMKPRIEFAESLRSEEATVRANMDAEGRVSRKFLEGFSKTSAGMCGIPTWITKDKNRTVDGMIFVEDLLTSEDYDPAKLAAKNNPVSNENSN